MSDNLVVFVGGGDVDNRLFNVIVMNADLWSASNFDNVLHKVHLDKFQEHATLDAASNFSRYAVYFSQRKSMRRRREGVRAKREEDRLDHAIREHDEILRKTFYDLGANVISVARNYSKLKKISKLFK